ncbi:hypothetical protein TKK_0005765 [Trichogramma kaykai]
MNCDNDKFAKSAYGKKKSNKLRSVLDSSSDEEQTQKYYSQTDSDEENTPSIISSELSSSSWHLRQSKIDLPIIPPEKENNFPTNDNINDDELGLSDNLPQNRNDLFEPEYNNVPLQVANERQLVPLELANNVPRNNNINDDELGLPDGLLERRNDVFVPEHNNVPIQMANERPLLPLQQENYVPRNDNINNEGPENVVEGLLPPMIAPIVDEVIVDENNPYGLIAAYAKVTYRRLQKLDLLRPAYQEPYEPLGMVGDMVSLNI